MPTTADHSLPPGPRQFKLEDRVVLLKAAHFANGALKKRA